MYFHFTYLTQTLQHKHLILSAVTFFIKLYLINVPANRKTKRNLIKASPTTINMIPESTMYPHSVNIFIVLHRQIKHFGGLCARYLSSKHMEEIMNWKGIEWTADLTKEVVNTMGHGNGTKNKRGRARERIKKERGRSTRPSSFTARLNSILKHKLNSFSRIPHSHGYSPTESYFTVPEHSRLQRLLHGWRTSKSSVGQWKKRSCCDWQPHSPMVELEARSPVGCSQEGLKGTGQVHKHVTHQKEPADTQRKTGFQGN